MCVRDFLFFVFCECCQFSPSLASSFARSLIVAAAAFFCIVRFRSRPRCFCAGTDTGSVNVKSENDVIASCLRSEGRCRARGKRQETSHVDLSVRHFGDPHSFNLCKVGDGGGGAGSHQLGRGRAFRRGGGFCTPVGMTGGEKGDQRNKGGELQPRRVSEKKEG